MATGTVFTQEPRLRSDRKYEPSTNTSVVHEDINANIIMSTLSHPFPHIYPACTHSQRESYSIHIQSTFMWFGDSK